MKRRGFTGLAALGAVATLALAACGGSSSSSGGGGGGGASGPVRAENLVRSSDQQSCSPCRPAVMIIDHVPTVHVPTDHAASCVAAARPA
jgi:hypothetical protein